MSQVGEISVKITANTQDYDAKTKRVQKSTRELSKELRSSINEWGKWGAAVASAATLASGAIVRSNLNNIRELSNVSRAANETVASFQRGAYAAEQFGISQEKFGDILKDVNDRVGDFLTTGGGPMRDFFENIAPKIGVTAEQFKNLSGSQALQLYISSLEKANLNQQEMTFFMEAMASDSTRLLPLFRENGKAMSEMAKSAEALGIGLSEIEVKNALEAQKTFSSIATLFQNQMMKAVADLAPAITMIAEELIKSKEGAEGFDVSLSAILPVAKNLAKLISAMTIGVKTLRLAAQGVYVVFLSLVKVVHELGLSIQEFLVDATLEFVSLAKKIPFVGDQFDGITNSLGSYKSEIEESSRLTSGFLKEAVSDLGAMRQELVNMATGSISFDNIDRVFEEMRTRILANREKINQEVSAGVSLGGATTNGEAAQPKSVEEDPELLFEYNKTQAILEHLGQRYLSQEALQMESLTRQMEMLKQHREQGLITEREYQEKKKGLEEDAAKAEAAITVGGANTILGLLAKKSKTALKVQKAFSLAQAGVAIATGIARAQELGFPANIFEAFRVASVGAGAVSSIKSAKAGAASIPSSGGGAAPPPQQAPPQAPREPSRVFNVKLIGQNQNSQAVRDLLEQINEQASDGFAINTSGAF